MNYKVTCPICRTVFKGGSFDNCPLCKWTYEYDNYEGEENDTDGANPVSYNQAKENFKNGLDKWGDPLKR